MSAAWSSNGCAPITLRAPHTQEGLARWLAVVANATVVPVGHEWEIEGQHIRINNPSSIALITFAIRSVEQDNTDVLTFDQFVSLVQHRARLSPLGVLLKITPDGVMIENEWCQAYTAKQLLQKSKPVAQWVRVLHDATH